MNADEISRFTSHDNIGETLIVRPGFADERKRYGTTAALLGFAEKDDADLIVAGTRGAGLMQRLLLGSVATRLMRHSTRSLLIVPDLKEEGMP